MMRNMRPTFANGNKATISKLLEVRRQAQKDKEPRVVLRIQGILMSLDGQTTGEIANHLKVHRSTVPLWIDHWNQHGEKGLWEGHRSGRPRHLSPAEREQLCDILDSGPAAYGLETGIWTSPLVRQVIAEEFGQAYHPGHVRKLLEQVVVPAFYRRRHRIYLIRDNASHHKKQETYAWFKANRRYLEVFQLPPYWPELNATERIWNYTRKYVTHNRFFERPQDLCDALFRRFDYVRHHPQEIEALLHPFF